MTVWYELGINRTLGSISAQQYKFVANNGSFHARKPRSDM